MDAQPVKTPLSRRSMIGAVLRVTSGNFLEQFDFFLFGFYAVYIAKAFFPADSEFASLMLTFAVFGAGFLMRPLGAILLGSYVDRMGRRKGLVVTLSIMAMGTVLIAFVPTYATIGVAAPILVLIGRLLQGFSAGVEVGGVSVYLSEIAPPGRKGFYISFQSASQQIAIIAAASIGYAINRWLSAAEIADWGWRIPFFIGCGIIPIVFILRSSLQETEAFMARTYRPTTKEIFRTVVLNWQTMLAGMMLMAMVTTTFYFIAVYTPTFGKAVLHLNAEDSLIVTLCVGLSNFFWVPIGGALSDRIGRRPILLVTALLAVFTSYPAMSWLADAPSFERLLTVLLWFSFFYCIYNGAMLPTLTEIMPVYVRTVGFALAYSLATAVLGGLTPAVSTALVGMTGSKSSPAWWLTFSAILGLLATLTLFRKNHTGEEPKVAKSTAGASNASGSFVKAEMVKHTG